MLDELCILSSENLTLSLEDNKKLHDIKAYLAHFLYVTWINMHNLWTGINLDILQ